MGGSRPGAGRCPSGLRISHIGVRPNYTPNNTQRSNPQQDRRCFQVTCIRPRRRAAGLVGDGANSLSFLSEFGVVVPTGVHHHHEAECRALQAAAPSKVWWRTGRVRLWFHTVHLPGVAGASLGEIAQLGTTPLHAKKAKARTNLMRDAIRSRSPFLFGEAIRHGLANVINFSPEVIPFPIR